MTEFAPPHLGKTLAPALVKPDGKPKTLAINMMLRESGIPVANLGKRLPFQSAAFTSSNPMARKASLAMEKFVVNLREYYVSNSRPIDQLPEDTEKIGSGVILIDTVGNSAATAIASATLLECFYCYNLRTRLTSLADYLNGVRKGYSDSFTNPEDLREALYQGYVETAPIVAIVDAGREYHAKESDFANAEFLRLLLSRYRNAKPTLITTSIPQDKWKLPKNFGETTGRFLSSNAFKVYQV